MKVNGDYILDSNIIIDIFRNDAPTIKSVQALGEIYIPAIVLGELHYGAYKSNQPAKRTLEILELKRKVHVLPVTDRTAQLYGEVKNKLRLKGNPIPENDIWIAAIAMENGLPLLSNDAHFSKVEGLTVTSL